MDQCFWSYTFWTKPVKISTHSHSKIYGWMMSRWRVQNKIKDKTIKVGQKVICNCWCVWKYWWSTMILLCESIIFFNKANESASNNLHPTAKFKYEDKLNITEITEDLKTDICKLSPINILFHKFYYHLSGALKADMAHSEYCPLWAILLFLCEPFPREKDSFSFDFLSIKLTDPPILYLLFTENSIKSYL